LSETKIPYYLSFNDVIRVLRLVDESPFQEMEVELEGLKVRVVQEKEEHLATHKAVTKTSAPEAAQPAPAKAEKAHVVAAPAAPVAEVGTPVVAPLAGTFYRAPAPGATPFVEVGTKVEEGDVVGILEIMKLMNNVTAPCAGVIREIRAKNEEFVEFGQVLAIIDAGRGA
jgi:acetyl-CoA carboxylase biotin carboxyl carrier protein